MRQWNAFSLAVIIGVLSCQSTMAQSNPFDGFVIIANTAGVAFLSEDEASSVFRGKKSVWSNGKPILIVFPSSRNPASTLIARRLFSTDTQGMQRYWLSQVFQGRANAPVFLEEWDAVIKKVRDVEGAVAMVPKGVVVPVELILPVR
jgi:ABC-type phosphate transport system substrate-binding protein